MTNTDDLIALPDTNNLNRSRESVMLDIFEMTSAIEGVILSGYEEDELHSLMAITDAIDWEELEIEENTFEFRILNSLHEIAIDILD